MKIRTFPADGFMTIETTPSELRDAADRLATGELVEIEQPGSVTIRIKPDDIDDFYPDDALPYHYRDNGLPCSWSGHVLTYCPNGCDHAEHYGNDGHRGCEDVGKPDPRKDKSDAG